MRPLNAVRRRTGVTTLPPEECARRLRGLHGYPLSVSRFNNPGQLPPVLLVVEEHGSGFRLAPAATNTPLRIALPALEVRLVPAPGGTLVRGWYAVPALTIGVVAGLAVFVLVVSVSQPAEDWASRFGAPVFVFAVFIVFAVVLNALIALKVDGLARIVAEELELPGLPAPPEPTQH